MDSVPRPFQIFLYSVFGVMFVLAIILLSTYSPSGGDGPQASGSVTVWGVIESTEIQPALNDIRGLSGGITMINYRRLDLRDFDRELNTAIAEGRGPDVVIIPHTELVTQRAKLFPFSYEQFTLRDFQDTYIEGFELYARPEGLLAFPLMVDPLVMYWNRDIFASNGMAQPPRTWEDLVNSTVPSIVRRDFDRRIQMSPVAMGEYRNNRNAFATISALLMQGGSSLVTEVDGQYRIRLNHTLQAGQGSPLIDTARFYSSFAAPTEPIYSWNRTFTEDRAQFIAERLALYFGFGSEYRELRRQNPNLNFDMVELPQGDGATIRRTYGTYYAVGLLRSANNLNGGFFVAQQLTTPARAKQIADRFNMAPAHRSSIAAGNPAPNAQLVYNAALTSRGWLNPNYQATNAAFQQMIEDILAGRRAVGQAAADTVNRIQQTFR